VCKTRYLSSKEARKLITNVHPRRVLISASLLAANGWALNPQIGHFILPIAAEAERRMEKRGPKKCQAKAYERCEPSNKNSSNHRRGDVSAFSSRFVFRSVLVELVKDGSGQQNRIVT
jgi:hypothetical protein